MTVTNQKATQLSNLDAKPQTLNKVNEVSGKVRVAKFDFTQDGAGDATSTVKLAHLPSGRLTILPALSYLATSDFGGSTATLDVGYGAYTEHDGTAVVADVDALVAAKDVAGAATKGLLTQIAGAIEIESKAGVDILATVNTAGIPDAATISGWIAYVQD